MGEGHTFTVLGARGSWPVSNPEMMQHGGRTTSFMIDLDAATTMYVDAGTGLAATDEPNPSSRHHYHVFLTHYHLDHIQGLQFFKPLYRPESDFTFYGVAPPNMTVQAAVAGIYQAPWFPVSLESTPSTKEYVPLEGNQVVIDDLRIVTTQLNHPQGVTGYRIDGPRASVVVATDHEAGNADADARLVELAAGADFLLHDAQYTPQEHNNLYTGWGHSTWVDAVEIAQRAGAGQLILTSHDPARTDVQVTQLIELSRARFPNTIAAHEGLQLQI